MNLDNIFPLIIPATEYRNNAEKMPHYKFANKEFLLTWVILQHEEPIEYVSQYLYKTLDKKFEGWQAQTFENLRLSISVDEIFFTRQKMSADGKRIIFLVFMNADSIGCSRVLLSYELNIAFPNGYYIAIPDRSCGLIIAKDITAEELDEAKKMVAKTFGSAADAISDSLHAPDEFKLPAEWLTPSDEDFSKEMTDEIISICRLTL